MAVVAVVAVVAVAAVAAALFCVTTTYDTKSHKSKLHPSISNTHSSTPKLMTNTNCHLKTWLRLEKPSI